MYKKLLLVSLVVISTCTLMAQSTPQKLSDKVTVTFPGKPEEQKLGNGAGAFSYKKDSSQTYIGMSVDLSPMGLSAELVQSLGDGLWDQMLATMPAQMGGSTIVKSDKTTFKGKSSLYLEVDGKSSSNPEYKDKRIFAYMFFIGSSLHQVAYRTSGDALPAEAKSFFDSVTIAQ
jgi:hypothetical protein